MSLERAGRGGTGGRDGVGRGGWGVLQPGGPGRYRGPEVGDGVIAGRAGRAQGRARLKSAEAREGSARAGLCGRGRRARGARGSGARGRGLRTGGYGWCGFTVRGKEPTCAADRKVCGRHAQGGEATWRGSNPLALPRGGRPKAVGKDRLNHCSACDGGGGSGDCVASAVLKDHCVTRVIGEGVVRAPPEACAAPVRARVRVNVSAEQQGVGTRLWKVVGKAVWGRTRGSNLANLVLQGLFGMHS